MCQWKRIGLLKGYHYVFFSISYIYQKIGEVIGVKLFDK